MTTKEDFFAHVQNHYSVTLQDHHFWDLLVRTNKFASSFADNDALIVDFIKLYSVHAYKIPELALLTDDLFFSILQKRLNKANLNVWQIPSAVNIFNAWTLQGTRTLPSTYLEPLVPTLKDMFESGPTRERAAAKIVSKNDILWSFLRPYILNTLAEGLDYIGDDLSFQTALYRHSPERAAAYSYIDPSQMYKEMCGANELSEMIKPTLMNMRSIFTGFHNNALAWHTALAVCAKDDPTIVGSWMQMSETFSSLRLEPKHQDAWQFWHLLRECVKDDASGQELIAALADDKKEMASAFADGWSIVDALHEGDERYAHASNMHQSHQHVELALPTMCSDEHRI